MSFSKLHLPNVGAMPKLKRFTKKGAPDPLLEVKSDKERMSILGAPTSALRICKVLQIL